MLAHKGERGQNLQCVHILCESSSTQQIMDLKRIILKGSCTVNTKYTVRIMLICAESTVKKNHSKNNLKQCL